jgi:methyltransferase (TIGR00027 family)
MANPNSISETAIVTASLRALACYEDDGLVRHKDSLAQLFLPDEKRVPLADGDIRNQIKKMIPEGLYEYVIVRTGYYDDLFCDHLMRDIPQIVLLGARFDSRPHRYRDLIRETSVFEADAPATQEYKRGVLEKNQIACHKNIRYIPIDFEKDDLAEQLVKAGYRPELQTLYIWEGVTFYLTPAATASVLRALRAVSPSRSILSFDFQTIDEEQSLIDTGLENEKIRFGIKSGTAEEFLNEFGYSVLELVNADEMGRRYLTANDGSRFGSVKSMMNIVTAEMT